MLESTDTVQRRIVIDSGVALLFVIAAFVVYQFILSKGMDDTGLLFAGVVVAFGLFAWRRLRDMDRLEEASHFASIIDPLTAVYNQSYMRQNLEIELERAARMNTPLSLMLIDIGGLRRINEEFGNEKGDNTILAFSTLLTDSVRKVDMVGRWGGGTFMLLYPGTAAEGAGVVAERIMENVQANPFGKVGTLTVTAGVITVNPDEGADDVVQRVSMALANAKKGGADNLIMSEQ